MYFAEVKSGLWWLSNAVVLVGSGGYTEVKRREMKEQHQQASAQQAKVELMEQQLKDSEVKSPLLEKGPVK